MTIAYFDCFSGAGGDMIVGSLIDAGADVDALRASIDALGVSGYALSIERITKQGFAATRFDVRLDEAAPQPHRHLKHVVEIINRAALSPAVKERAIRVFTRLAEAEACVHGTSIEQVHFHEVGAVDAIIDVIAALRALELLDVTQIVCAPIPTGSGTVGCAHGIMPVPAPATAHLLRGVPLAQCDEVGELTTPTAAALLTTLADRFGGLPGMTVETVGYGAGTRDGQRRPNVLRVFVGAPAENEGAASCDVVTVLETNLDDVSPEIVAHCVDRLFESGVLDAFTVPIHMKKGRSGVLLTALCTPSAAREMEGIIYAETATFGIRRHDARRSTLRRRHEPIETPYGSVRIKIGEGDGYCCASPEYEDCKQAALRHKMSLREVFEAARTAWSRSAAECPQSGQDNS